MQLRDHPLMSCAGFRAWPSYRWRSVGGEQDVFLSGEIGILKEIRITDQPPLTAKLYLLMEHEKRLYMGIALIRDAAFARQIYALLEKHLDEPIKDIGGLDVEHLL